MSAIPAKLEEITIFETIKCHPAWFGLISGMFAEEILSNRKKTYLFLLREGEFSQNKNEKNYYVSFVAPDGTIRHQPLIIHHTEDGWRYTNGRPNVRFDGISIDPVLHDIMHCEIGECIPLIKQ